MASARIDLLRGMSDMAFLHRYRNTPMATITRRERHGIDESDHEPIILSFRARQLPHSSNDTTAADSRPLQPTSPFVDRIAMAGLVLLVICEVWGAAWVWSSS